MNEIVIVTDSSAALTPQEISENNIHIVPLQVMIEQKAYQDGVNLTRDEFVEKMNNSKELPITSQPSAISFYETYEEILKNQPNAQILSIHIASGLSGTYQNAVNIANDEQFNGQITVVDSHSIDRGLAFQVLKAVECIKQGKDMNFILTEMESVRNQTKIYLTASSLKNLVAGGRISKTAGLIGTLLNIKVGVEFTGETNEVRVKGRGQKTIDEYYDKVIKQMQDLKHVSAIGISHVGEFEKAEEMKERLQKLFPDTPIVTMTTASIVATHVGQGGFAILYYGK